MTRSVLIQEEPSVLTKLISEKSFTSNEKKPKIFEKEQSHYFHIFPSVAKNHNTTKVISFNLKELTIDKQIEEEYSSKIYQASLDNNVLNESPSTDSIVSFYKALYKFLDAFIQSQKSMSISIDYKDPYSLGKFINKILNYVESARIEIQQLRRIMKI